ncbi:hypothetical protein HDV57DRAFT_460887 [Trichoderma longibrachiatum]
MLLFVFPSSTQRSSQSILIHLGLCTCVSACWFHGSFDTTDYLLRRFSHDPSIIEIALSSELLHRRTWPPAPGIPPPAQYITESLRPSDDGWTRLQDHVFSLNAPYRRTLFVTGGQGLHDLCLFLQGVFAYRGISVSRDLYEDETPQSPIYISLPSPKWRIEMSLGKGDEMKGKVIKALTRRDRAASGII